VSDLAPFSYYSLDLLPISVLSKDFALPEVHGLSNKINISYKTLSTWL
jgi:hypothetical protein